MKTLEWILSKSEARETHTYNELETKINYRFFMGNLPYKMVCRMAKEIGIKWFSEMKTTTVIHNGLKYNINYTHKYKSDPFAFKIWISNEPEGEAEMKTKGLTFSDLSEAA